MLQDWKRTFAKLHMQPSVDAILDKIFPGGNLWKMISITMHVPRRSWKNSGTWSYRQLDLGTFWKRSPLESPTQGAWLCSYSQTIRQFQVHPFSINYWHCILHHWLRESSPDGTLLSTRKIQHAEETMQLPRPTFFSSSKQTMVNMHFSAPMMPTPRPSPKPLLEVL